MRATDAGTIGASTPGDSGAIALLCIFITVRLALPSQFVIAPLRGAGSPALLIGIACLCFWVLVRLQRWHHVAGSPLLLGIAVFVIAILASYLLAMMRPINPEELSVSTLTVLTMASWFGPMLLAHDGLSSSQLVFLTRYLTVLGGMMALFGIVQFVTGEYWVDRISIPGLTAHQTVYSATERGGFTRPAGTAVHPIEYGAVLVILLPLALVRGVGGLEQPSSIAASMPEARPSHGLISRWWPAAAMSMAIMLSVSRSAIIGLLVGVVLVAATWTPRQRIAATGGLIALVTVVFLTVPGMLGTIVGLFTDIGKGDTSVASRVESYAIAEAYIAQFPMFGRGIGTFLPRYHIFDNQYLQSSVEIGLLGVLAFCFLIITVLYCAARTYSRSSDPRLRATATAAGAAVATGAVSLALFDGFSFPMMPGLWFLAMGLCGAAYRNWSTADALPPVQY